MKENNCMPSELYELGMPLEWFNEHVDEDGVFRPSKGIVAFMKRRAKEMFNRE